MTPTAAIDRERARHAFGIPHSTDRGGLPPSDDVFMGTLVHYDSQSGEHYSVGEMILKAVTPWGKRMPKSVRALGAAHVRFGALSLSLSSTCASAIRTCELEVRYEASYLKL